jgi:hypothetical protein
MAASNGRRWPIGSAGLEAEGILFMQEYRVVVFPGLELGRRGAEPRAKANRRGVHTNQV